MSNIPNMFSVHQLLNCVVIIFPNPMNTLLRIMANKLKIYLNGFYDRSIQPGMYDSRLLCKYISRTCSLIFQSKRDLNSKVNKENQNQSLEQKNFDFHISKFIDCHI